MNTNHFQQNLHELLAKWFDGLVHISGVESPIYTAVALLITLLLGVFTHLISQWFLAPQLEKAVTRSRIAWDDDLLKHGFFRYAFHLVPALAIFIGCHILLPEESLGYTLVTRASLVYMLFSGLMAVNAALNTAEDSYNASNMSKKAPITGFIQVIKLVAWIITILFTISVIINKSPIILLSGVTALAAVLMLIFRDTILGFVAGIQIAANRMFNNGDWIQIDKLGVDGEITEIGLTNVKVQNWDKTISTLPTYALTNESIKNWRGMSESGGRRIKRAIQLDLNSVKFCDQALLERLANVDLLTDYLARKKVELNEYNGKYSDNIKQVNARQLTNVGTFRAYLRSYLQQHPDINDKMTLIVRQLNPNEYGLPIEIYCFSANQEWAQYEGIQADIFDHIFSVLALFELRVYQRDNPKDNSNTSYQR